MTGAQAIVEIFIEQGVDTVFGYPGGTVLPLYDALYKRRDVIRHVRTAHEQGAAHAADGYARAAGKAGVCIATSGPGATNLVTGIANAFMDSVPVVFITGNVELSLIGTDSFQEVDTTGITLPITKHNWMVQSVSELPRIIRQAFAVADSGRKGPVLVDIPKDILQETIPALPDAVSAAFAPPQIPVQAFDGKTMQPTEISLIADLLNRAKRPFILVGGGVRSSEASDILCRFAETLCAPVSCTLMAMGEIPNEHPLFIGNSGLYGNPEAREAMEACDVLLAVGTRFSNRIMGQHHWESGPRPRVIHIDRDRAEINKIIPSDYFLVGDAKEALTQLLGLLSDSRRAEGWSPIKKGPAAQKTEDRTAAMLSPNRIFPALRKIVGAEAYIVTDVGLHQIWTANYYPFSRPGHLITSGGLGTMGFGLGAAVGVQLAHPEVPVVLVTGDGSFSMNCIELSTLHRMKLPILIVLMNNGALGMVKQIQKRMYGRRYAESELRSPPSYVTIGRGYHVESHVVRTLEAFERYAALACINRKAMLLDCRIGGTL